MAFLRFGRTITVKALAVGTGRMIMPVALMVLLIVSAAQAHRVNVFAWVEGDTVFTESKFPGDSPVHEGKIVALNSKGDQVLSGNTDEQGQFSFDLGPIRSAIGAGPLTIVLKAGMGHQNKWTLTAEELGLAEQGVSVPETSAETPVPAPTGIAEEEREPIFSDSPCLSRAEIEQIVEAAVDRKMSPVMKVLVSIQEKLAVGVDDVFAGLGYILGLTGVAAYFSTRRKEQK